MNQPIQPQILFPNIVDVDELMPSHILKFYIFFFLLSKKKLSIPIPNIG